MAGAQSGRGTDDTSQVGAEAAAWIAATWDPDLPLRSWWQALADSGWGFPAWTGGTLSFIDTVGIQTFVSECERLAAAHGPRFQPSAWLKARAARGEGFY